MFNEYYYIDKLEKPIYFSIITLNNSVETTLYAGKQLLRRKSLQRGIHILQKDDIKLKIDIKWFKVLPELRVNNELQVPEKIRRKELKRKLQFLKIHNELNPRETPKTSFKLRSIKTPLLLIIIGSTWQVLIGTKGKIWEIPSMILFVIAYIYLFGGIIDKIPDRHMDNETKGKFKFLFGIAGMILTQIIIGKILNLTK